MFVAAETGELTKGRHTVGVAGQYTGTAGRSEHAQVGVDLVDVTGAGQAFVDRELFRPVC